ncbi:UbiA family prenyltransferase [Candidatus Desantisbacteria bacterium]|nr:UbiA family prenyltransferase [Candidatus Desantisbacteria bacterium]
MLKIINERLKIYSELTLFPFVIFTLPFALTGAMLAQFTLKGNIIPKPENIFWIILATFSARNAGMAANRLIDKDIDARNPRTCDRAMVKGVIKEKEVIIFIIISIVLFILSAWMLNPLCLYIAPIPLLLLLLYPAAKRYTWLNHFVLGSVLFFAPVGGWIAVKGSWDFPATILGTAVFFWTSGFDIIYDREDIDFYRKEKLHSIPQLLGEDGSRILSLVLHFITIFLLAWLPKIAPLGNIYSIGVAVIAILIIFCHIFTYKTEVLRTNKTFFWVNSLVSIGFFSFMLMDLIGGK